MFAGSACVCVRACAQTCWHVCRQLKCVCVCALLIHGPTLCLKKALLHWNCKSCIVNCTARQKFLFCGGGGVVCIKIIKESGGLVKLVKGKLKLQKSVETRNKVLLVISTFNTIFPQLGNFKTVSCKL